MIYKHGKISKTIVLTTLLIVGGALFTLFKDSSPLTLNLFDPFAFALASARGLPALLFVSLPGLITSLITKRSYWGIIVSICLSYIMYLGYKGSHGNASLDLFVILSFISSLIILYLNKKQKNV